MAAKISRRGFAHAVAGAALMRSAAASGGSLERFESLEPHMGTMFRIVLHAPGVAEGKEAFHEAFEEIRRLDEALSDYREDSELNRLCRAPAGRPVELSDALFDVLALSQEISEETGGAFDVTLGPLIRLWRRARKDKRLPSDAERRAAQASCGWRKLRLDPDARTATLAQNGMQLDLGGVAKGLAADRALGVLERRGIASALAAAGGDVRSGAAPPGEAGWKIGVRGLDAFDGGYSQVVTLSNAAVSTSGDAEQFVEIDGVRYSHIVDPQTGLGLTERLSVTVIASFGARADALATAASVLGAGRGLEFIESQSDAEAFVIRAVGEGYVEAATQGFPSRTPNRAAPARVRSAKPSGAGESLPGLRPTATLRLRLCSARRPLRDGLS